MSRSSGQPDPSLLQIESPAKVNLALSVGAPRPDGYHPIASWMVAVDFADAVTLRPAATGAPGRFEITFAADAPQRQAVDWPIEKDLGWRALQLLTATVGRTLALDITVRKRIPTGAGLGGGSGNAAAVLVGASRLLRLNLSEAQLMELAGQLGCDVAFGVAALGGRASAIATGLGEQLDAAPLASPVHLTLLLPPLTCPTAAVYRRFDAQGAGASAEEPRIRRVVGEGASDAGLFNDLAEPAMSVTPELADLRARLTEALGRRVHVTGSGAAMFVLARDRDEASALSAQASAAGDVAAVATSTL
jgi:4-diphosphocytidyl-2-C-methyl-D-erythritol kinase